MTSSRSQGIVFEGVRIEHFGAVAAIEAFNIGVLIGLARVNALRELRLAHDHS
jgi:hypothetical protein